MIARRIGRLRTMIERATTVPLLVRAGVALCGVLAVVVAWPTSVVLSRYGLPLLVLAACPAFAPRGRGGTVAALVVVAGWLLDTTWYDARVALWRVVCIAGLLYLGHTSTALAAALPYDALVDAGVVARWLGRALLVVLASAVLTVVALALTAQLAGGAFLLATLVGLAAAVGLTLLLARLLRRV